MRKSVFSNVFFAILFTFFFQLVLAGPSLPLDCKPKFAGAVIIHGTNGNDEFKKHHEDYLRHYVNGTFVKAYPISPNKNYIINTGPGHDEVDYFGGTVKHVQICTGSGNDKVAFSARVDATNFWVYTDSGNDDVTGYGRNLFISGGSGNDDVLAYGSRRVSVSGDEGSDCLRSNNPKASLNGLGGNDYLVAMNSQPPQASTLNGSGGNDICVISSGDERLYSCEVVTAGASAHCWQYGWQR